ncbi:MAG: hypothetical protein AAF206_23635, partial [Bacteroidota bacterium]
FSSFTRPRAFHPEDGVEVYQSSANLLVQEIAAQDLQRLEQSIDLSTQANGLYFVRVTVNGAVSMKKIFLHR